MCAAKVLADVCEEVCLLERDVYPDTISDRRGVPQGKMFHTLLERGRRDMEDIFPGLHKLLDERKLPKISVGFNCALMTPFGWSRNLPVPVPRSLFCTRGFLETAMRDLFLTVPGVRLIEEATVTGLLSDGDATCTGVTYKVRNGDEVKELNADLVIDASGASSRARQWLSKIGIAPPREHELDPLLTYGGLLLKMKPGVRFPRHWWWTHGAFIQRVPPEDNKAAHLIRQEGDLWLLTLVAGDGFDIPKTLDEVPGFLASMRSPLVHDMYPFFDAVGELTSYRLPKNRWKYYESWDQRLDGFIAMAASTCVFNPNMGQGMSVAAGDAGILRRCLKKTTSTRELPRLFFAEQAKFQRNAYQLACSNDLKFTAVEGKRTARTRLFNWYRDRIIAAGAADPWVAREASAVDLLLEPITKLYKPIFVIRTLYAGLFLFWKQKPNAAERVAAQPPHPAEITTSWTRKLQDFPGLAYRYLAYRLKLSP